MADLERFGAELTLNATQFISTVGQVERANVRLEQTLKATGTAINDLGVKFDKSFKGAERFGTLIDTSTGRVRKGLDLLNEKIDQSVNKHAQLAESGSASHRKLAQSLEKLNTAENTYVNALENVRKAIIKQAEAGKDDLEAKEKVNKAVRTAQNVYRSYQKALQQVNTQQAKINRENNAVIASYQILGRRLAQTNTFWNRMSATVQNVVSKFAPLQRALSTIRAGLTGAGSGAAGTAGLLGVLGKAAGAAGIALGVVVKAVSLAGGAFKALLSPLTRAISAFKNFFRIASQIAVGILIRDTIRGIVRELRELAFAGFEAVKFFQALEIRLDLMELRALRAEGAVGSLGDMMGRASERAQLLLQWIKELSLVSPFTVETLATTTSLNLAMGFTEDMAKRLTIAIAEYTAGMGLSNQVMERIVFNFGQMKAAGKVTATEMRDLARGAFLPLTDVLDEAARLMNVTTDDIMEFRKAAAEGAVSVDTFFQAFINVVDRDFAGASERFSRTLDGVRNRLANFIKTVLGLEVLGPIAARFAEIASNALDKIMQPEIIGRAKLLGETIVRAFDLIRNKAQALSISLGHLWRALGLGSPTFESLAFAVAKFTFYMRAAIDLVRGVVQRITAYFEDMGETLTQRMGRWGYNIVAVFARGMASAARLVVKVITFIANVITSLLKTSSPPKILPDLPQWGMEAMAEYLRGFTEADFDILEGIQDPIKDALDILEETGRIGANQAGKIFAQISKEIAKALTIGKIDEDLFGRIEAITGPFGQEIAELARRQVRLAAATEEVRKAEIRLDQARKSHSAARVRTNSLIRDYNKSLREGADPAFLKAKLAEIHASEDAARAAYEEQKAAEADLERKEETLVVVKQLLDLQERLVNQLLELTKAQIIQPEQPDLGGAGGGGAGEDIGEGVELPPLPELPEVELPDADAIEAEIDRIFEQARLEVEKSIRELKEAFGATGLGEAFGELVTSWEDAWERIVKYYDEEIEPRIDRFLARWDEHIPGLQESFGAMSETISEAWAELQTILDDLDKTLEEAGISGISISVEGVVDTIVWLLKTLGWVFTGIVTLVIGIVAGAAEWSARITGYFDDVWESIVEGWERAKEAWNDFFTGKISFTEFVEEFFGGLNDIVDSIENLFIEPVKDLWEEFKESIIAIVIELWDRLVGNSIIPDMMNEIYDAITKPLKELKEEWDELWQSLTDWWYDTLEPAIQDVIDWVIELKDEIIENYKKIRDDALEPFRVFFEETLPAAGNAFRNKFNEIMSWLQTNVRDPIVAFIDGPLTDLGDMFRDTLTNALNTFKVNVLDPLASGFDSVKSAVNRLWTWIGTLKDRLLAFPFKLLQGLMGRSPSPLAVGINSASQAMKNMATTALPQIQKQLVMMQSAGLVSSPVVQAPSVMAGSSSSQSVNVNMGGVNITSAMDEAVFEARVKNIVQKSLRL